MRKIIVLFIILWTMVYGLRTSEAEAGVVIKIRAVNPLDEEAVTPIKSYLPKGVKPEDVLNVSRLASEPVNRLTGKQANWQTVEDFEVKFDETKEQYYVEQEIVLAPKEVMVLEVELRDVWVIVEERIEGLRKEVSLLAGEPVSGLTGKPANWQTIKALKDEIIKNLDAITQRQVANTVALVGVERHIEVYEENVEALKQVEADVEMLGNLVGNRQ